MTIVLYSVNLSPFLKFSTQRHKLVKELENKTKSLLDAIFLCLMLHSLMLLSLMLLSLMLLSLMLLSLMLLSLMIKAFADIR